MIIEGKFFIYFFVWFDSEKNKKNKKPVFPVKFQESSYSSQLYLIYLYSRISSMYITQILIYY